MCPKYNKNKCMEWDNLLIEKKWTKYNQLI